MEINPVYAQANMSSNDPVRGQRIVDERSHIPPHRRVDEGEGNAHIPAWADICT